MPNGIFPGLNLSIIRERSVGEAGRPLTISGRLTAVGLGIPAFIRVTLEGPDYEPQRVGFTTLSKPGTGDYSVAVIPPKDGRYEVYSEAFAFPPIPLLDILPPGPSLAESPRPPIVVGEIVEAGEAVRATVPTAPMPIRYPAPALTPIEVSPYIPITLPPLELPEPPGPTVIIIEPAPPAPPVEEVGEMPGGQILGFEVE